PGYTEYGRDNGIRLSAVWLTHDPEYPENLPAAPLVRYCVFRSIRSRIGIEVRSAIRIHSINRELNFFYRFLTR
ncbi:hypothetical protein, partial [Escherichia coli]|uniref:hypothetical protein n=1 Tax=Escherichia coli TaxID=562 RepID=UPI002147A4F2